MKEYIAAIDLGTTKVVSAIGHKTESGFKVIALKEAPSIGVSRGEVLNIQQVLNSLEPTIEQINQENDIRIKDVYVGIAGQNIRCESISSRSSRSKPDNLISESEINALEKKLYNSKVSLGEEIFHVLPQFYNIEEHLGIKNPIGMAGSQIEGNYKIFIGKTNSAECSSKVIERAKLNLKKLILEPVASAAAVLSDDEKEIGVAMVDIGGGTTDLLIYHDNTIRHTAIIPFGGNSITEDIKNGCNVSAKTAEQIKIQYGSSYTEFAPDNKTIVIPGIGGRESREVTFKFIANIIEARVEEIIEAIVYEIEISGYQEKLGAGIVVTGGSSALTHLVPFMRFKTGYGVRAVAPSKNISYDSCEGSFLPSSSTAVGLLLKGYEHSLEKEHIEPVAELVEALSPVNIGKTNNPGGIKKSKDHNKKKGITDIFGGLFDGYDNNNA